jgi:hypothetical protein
LEAKLRDRYFASLEGRELQVLVEGPLAERPGYVLGTSCRYTPVELPAGTTARGNFTRVVAGEVRNARIQSQ